MTQSPAHRELTSAMPVLRSVRYQIVLPKSLQYNCFSWAAGDTARWWVPPAVGPAGYWPPGLPATNSLANFVRAFETRGYRVCTDPSLEAGTEKIALYMHPGDRGCSHAARQHPSGLWISKIGWLHGIAHASPDDLTASRKIGYGQVVAYMARSIARKSVRV